MSEAKFYYLIAPLAYTGTGEGVFTYDASSEMPIGAVVTVPIGRRSSLGVVLEPVTMPNFATKPVGERVADTVIPRYLLDLAAWMADFYAASPSSVWSTILPTGLTKKRREKAANKVKPAQGIPTEPLTDQQAGALAAIRSSEHRVSLIHGVTGSGKTRIYLELAAEALAGGRSVIVLVPEITLTPQVVAQFEDAFGEVVLSTHSKLTEAERHRIWQQAEAAVLAGQPVVVVGPRSCLFLPLHRIGLIVVDEEHESSYKQEQHPRYHAVPTAARLGGLTDARVVLGSATPGLGELFLAYEGRIGLVTLTERANRIPLPAASIIDLRNKDLFTLSKFITQPLLAAVSQTLTEGRQSLLYLNRRGSASSQVCGDCGHVTTCPNCLLPLTFHADLMRLVCHHCNYRVTSAAVCPVCNGADLKLLGGGTKRIEAEVERLWPAARLARLDRDSATLAHIKATYAGLKAGTIDIVIGTQMIAKGLDLPAIDTIGIVSADTMLHLPDFSAAERTFDLISQVSGRAGRGERPGQIFIQTYSPSHPAIVAAAMGDYTGFATAELAERKLLAYPPYRYLVKLSVVAKTSAEAEQAGRALATELRQRTDLAVTGPAPAFIEHQGGKSVWVLTVKAARRARLVEVARALPDGWSADLDPLNLL